MSEQKKPEAGEWWQGDTTQLSKRAYVCGFDAEGFVIWQTASRSALKRGTVDMFTETHKHLPDCDSFDWQPETFPQWYLHESGHWGHISYVCRDSKTTYFCVDTYGRKTEPNVLTWAKHHDLIVRSGGWVKVTQTEAEARVRKPEQNILANCSECGEFRGHGHDEICKGKPEPVESPDDWVTQDRVPARARIDQEHWSNWGVDEWHTIGPNQISSQRKMTHGNVDEQEDTLSLRCRRRDLPPLPQETPKREYVRFWVNETSTSFHVARGEFRSIWPGYSELKHDGTGFYLEDGK